MYRSIGGFERSPGLDLGHDIEPTFGSWGPEAMGPDGDRNKYSYMKNKEFDYDQSIYGQITAQDILENTT